MHAYMLVKTTHGQFAEGDIGINMKTGSWHILKYNHRDVQ